MRDFRQLLIAEHLSARQIIVQCSQVAFVYLYIYFSVTVSVAPSISLSGPLGRGQFLCGLGSRASSCNVKVASSTLTRTTLFFFGGGLYATCSFCGGGFWRRGFDKPCAYVLNTGTEKRTIQGVLATAITLPPKTIRQRRKSLTK